MLLASCELLSISSLLELEGDSEAIEDYLGKMGMVFVVCFWVM